MTTFFVALILGLIAIGYATGSVVAIASQQPDFGNEDSPAVPSNPSTLGTSILKNGPGVNYVSDGSLTGMLITNAPATWPGASSDYPNAGLWNICTAVALAEGYNQGVGTAPYDLNNPGDLSPGDELGQAVSGSPQTHGGSSIICFATVEGGFIALYTKFDRIVNGRSSVYAATDTWWQVAAKYAGNSAAWLANVTNYLGVDPSSTPADYANS